MKIIEKKEEHLIVNNFEDTCWNCKSILEVSPEDIERDPGEDPCYKCPVCGSFNTVDK